MESCDVLVIGGGPAGMAAALSARAHGCRRVLLVERERWLGGVLPQCVHNGFGLQYFAEELTGPEYADRFIDRTTQAQIEVLTEAAVIRLCPQRSALVSGPGCGVLQVQPTAVILATGCRERPIGALAVTGTRPSGVFTAGAVQKMLNLSGYHVGERFVILGSGDVGLIVARQLALLGKEVVCVLEEQQHCGGQERNRINCLQAHNIPLRTECTVSRIHGTGRIEGVTIRHVATGLEEYQPCDTLVTSVGLIPERELSEEASPEGELPEWLFLCGNACYVHDTVDDVTVEAERIGKAAADFVKHGVRQRPQAAANPADAGGAGGVICVACPKSCRLTLTAHGYRGAVCGRKDPVIATKNQP